jgi:hypothetical protein
LRGNLLLLPFAGAAAGTLIEGDRHHSVVSLEKGKLHLELQLPAGWL